MLTIYCVRNHTEEDFEYSKFFFSKDKALKEFFLRKGYVDDMFEANPGWQNGNEPRFCAESGTLISYGYSGWNVHVCVYRTEDEPTTEFEDEDD